MQLIPYVPITRTVLGLAEVKMLDKEFGWWRSWISIPVAALALGAGLALVGYIANHVVESVAKLIGLLLGIGG